MSWGGSEKNRGLTRRFDQYALIVFWRMLDELHQLLNWGGKLGYWETSR